MEDGAFNLRFIGFTGWIALLDPCFPNTGVHQNRARYNADLWAPSSEFLIQSLGGAWKYAFQQVLR